MQSFKATKFRHNSLLLQKNSLVNYLSVENISKSFGERTLFENISFGINKDQKIAFIAKNGSGKTTLLNLLTQKKLLGSIAGEIYLGNLPWAYVDQEYLNLVMSENVFQNFRRVSNKTDIEVRNILSMFLFRGDKVFLDCSSLKNFKISSSYKRKNEK